MEGSGRGNNNSGRGRSRGRRGNYDDQQGGGRRGGAQNQGGGRGWDRGSPQQPPARPQRVSRPPPPGNLPPPPQAQAAASRPVAAGPSGGGGSTWPGRPWGPSSTTQPPPSSPAPVQPPAVAVQQLSSQTQTLTISEKKPSSSPQSGQIQAIRRPDRGGTLADRRINLVVNYFLVSFNEKGSIFHYDVDVKPVATNGKQKLLRKSDLRFIKDLAFPGAELLMTVYDGEKNVFSAIRLGEGKYMVEVSEGEDVRSGTYAFTIKLVKELKLSKLGDYLRGSLSSVPRDILQALDLVMKENPMRKRIALGNRSFSAANSADLRGGLAAYKGLMQSLKPTVERLFLCSDYSVLAFRKPLAVIEFLKQHIGMRDVNDVLRMKKDVINALRGLKVKVNHRRTNQKYTVIGLSEFATWDTTFELVDLEGGAPPRMINLVDYFWEKWGKEIKYKDIPCLDVGKPKKQNLIPMEFCVLAEGQSFPKENLDKNTAVDLKNRTLVKPMERQNTICDMVRSDDGCFGWHLCFKHHHLVEGMDKELDEVMIAIELGWRSF